MCPREEWKLCINVSRKNVSSLKNLFPIVVIMPVICNTIKIRTLDLLYTYKNRRTIPASILEPTCIYSLNYKSNIASLRWEIKLLIPFPNVCKISLLPPHSQKSWFALPPFNQRTVLKKLYTYPDAGFRTFWVAISITDYGSPVFSICS